MIRSAWAVVWRNREWLGLSALALAMALFILSRIGSPTVAPLEATWTAIAVMALIFTVWHLWDNWLNWQALMIAIKLGTAYRLGPRWWIALSSLVTSCGLLIVWLGFAGLGVAAMTVPPPLTSDRQTVSMVSAWLLVCIESVLAAVQIWQAWVRGQVRRLPPRVLP